MNHLETYRALNGARAAKNGAANADDHRFIAAVEAAKKGPIEILVLHYSGDTCCIVRAKDISQELVPHIFLRKFREARNKSLPASLYAGEYHLLGEFGTDEVTPVKGLAVFLNDMQSIGVAYRFRETTYQELPALLRYDRRKKR